MRSANTLNSEVFHNEQASSLTISPSHPEYARQLPKTSRAARAEQGICFSLNRVVDDLELLKQHPNFEQVVDALDSNSTYRARNAVDVFELSPNSKLAA